MSFSSDVKKELATIKPEKSCCALSELCGLYAMMGSLSLLGRGRVNVQFTHESFAVCRRTYTLLVQTLHVSPQIHYVTHARFGGTRKCVLTLGPIHSPAFLKAMGMMDESASLRSATPKIPLTRLCCMRAFLRGVMLGGGTMSNPEQSYHLELPCRDSDLQAMTAKCLQRMGLPIKLGARREHTYFYMKQSDQIVAFLTVVGAHTSVMQIEDLRVKKQVMGTVNRAMNCDNANLQKQMNASGTQVDAIRRLQETDQWRTLPPALQEIAQARLSNPDASLAELGEMLHPPIGKSGVNHRMRRLMAYLEADE
ncbi:MAG: DNA-binding protein WhiA [bacterium]|nr:DNA-binding protein WhiA [bacterium]